MLQHLQQLAIQAHNGTSFSPEKRGDSVINEYSSELAGDIATIQEIAEKHNQDATEAVARYRANYEKGLSNWLHSKSRCISSFVVGPAKFPVARAQKLNGWEQSKFEVFREWRRKALAAIERRMKPEVTPLTELDRYRKELADLEKRQQAMKDANRIIKKGKDVESGLKAIGFSDKVINKMKRTGFASWELTNNSANIRRIRDRITIMQEKQTNIETKGSETFAFEGGKVVLNHGEDRVQIIYDAKPDAGTISTLKSYGFRWAPSNKAWQRQLTPQARHAVKMVVPAFSY